MNDMPFLLFFLFFSLCLSIIKNDDLKVEA